MKKVKLFPNCLRAALDKLDLLILSARVAILWWFGVEVLLWSRFISLQDAAHNSELAKQSAVRMRSGEQPRLHAAGGWKWQIRLRVSFRKTFNS